MKYIITLSALIIFFFTNSIAEESPPKVTTQQFDNWTYQCVENNKNKNCEVSQTIRIQNTNINFSIAYTKFLNDKQKKIQLISIISPLGIDLKKKLLLRYVYFDDDKYCLKCFYTSGKSLPIFFNESKRKHKRITTN